jgi:hypothetical protein
VHSAPQPGLQIAVNGSVKQLFKHTVLQFEIAVDIGRVGKEPLFCEVQS